MKTGIPRRVDNIATSQFRRFAWWGTFDLGSNRPLGQMRLSLPGKNHKRDMWLADFVPLGTNQANPLVALALVWAGPT
jgi:hypothetical protein